MPAILEAARRHKVVVVNAPGNGVADDKSMYCHIPDLIAYYLAESPLLALGADLPLRGRHRARDRARPARPSW